MWYLRGPFGRQKLGDIKQKVQAHMKIAQKMLRTFLESNCKIWIKVSKQIFTHTYREREAGKHIRKDQDNIVYITFRINFYTSNK